MNISIILKYLTLDFINEERKQKNSYELNFNEASKIHPVLANDISIFVILDLKIKDYLLIKGSFIIKRHIEHSSNYKGGEKGYFLDLYNILYLLLILNKRQETKKNNNNSPLSNKTIINGTYSIRWQWSRARKGLVIFQIGIQWLVQSDDREDTSL